MYILVFTCDQYNEFKAVAEAKPMVKRMLALFEWTEEMQAWVAEMSRIEYCMLMLSIEEHQRRSKLLRRMGDLGRAQDGEFDSYLRGIRRDLDRINVRSQ